MPITDENEAFARGRRVTPKSKRLRVRVQVSWLEKDVERVVVVRSRARLIRIITSEYGGSSLGYGVNKRGRSFVELGFPTRHMALRADALFERLRGIKVLIS